MEEKTVLILGGGIAGLSAAAVLAKTGVRSLIVEKAPYLGGFAAQYACKATTGCVKCGACVVDEKMQQVVTRIARLAAIYRAGQRRRLAVRCTGLFAFPCFSNRIPGASSRRFS